MARWTRKECDRVSAPWRAIEVALQSDVYPAGSRLGQDRVALQSIRSGLARSAAVESYSVVTEIYPKSAVRKNRVLSDEISDRGSDDADPRAAVVCNCIPAGSGISNGISARILDDDARAAIAKGGG